MAVFTMWENGGGPLRADKGARSCTCVPLGSLLHLCVPHPSSGRRDSVSAASPHLTELARGLEPVSVDPYIKASLVTLHGKASRRPEKEDEAGDCHCCGRRSCALHSGRERVQSGLKGGPRA